MSRGIGAGDRAVLCMDGYAGRTETPVLIVGETLKRYRIRAIERTKIGGARWLYRGETALVPKHAIKPLPESEEREEEQTA